MKYLGFKSYYAYIIVIIINVYIIFKLPYSHFSIKFLCLVVHECAIFCTKDLTSIRVTFHARFHHTKPQKVILLRLRLTFTNFTFYGYHYMTYLCLIYLTSIFTIAFSLSTFLRHQLTY